MQSYRFLIVVFAILVLGAVGTHRRLTKPTLPATHQQTVDRMLASNQQVDEELFAGEGRVATGWKVEDLPVIEDTIQEDDLFVEAYDQADDAYDPLRAYHLSRNLYQQDKSSEMLSLLVRRGIDVYDFSGTLALLMDLDEQGRLEEVVEPQQFLFVLFNTLDLTPTNLNRIETIIKDYHQQGMITAYEQTLYMALLAYAKGDLSTYGSLMSSLAGSPLRDWQEQYEATKANVYGFNDPAPYYIDAMVGLDLFGRGWYNLAVVGGDRVTKKDISYILGYQLIAYGSFYLSDWRRAYEAFERLRQLDEASEELYLFLEGIALFEMEDYPTALLAFLKVTNPIYRTDTLRYLLLTYYHLGDTNKTGEVMKHLLRQSDIGAYDFFTVFDMFFFEPVRRRQEVVLFASFFELAEQWLATCYEKGKDEYAYICLYGKAGLFLANGQETQAKTYLERLVRLYPNAGLYEKLGDIAYQQGDLEAAQTYFTQALALGIPTTHQAGLLQKLHALE